MRLGLGTGSTVRHFLEALGEALGAGTIRDVAGVPTSLDTETRCRALGIPVLELSEGLRLDLAVDGADEVSPALDLIKGLGGALLREKIVVEASDRFVVIADDSKSVRRLGEKAPLPVEVVPFGWSIHLPFLRELGADPRPRRTPAGDLVRTDNGNHVIDLHFSGGIPDAPALERTLHGRAGIVETGLFLGRAIRAYLGGEKGVVTFDREPR